MAAVNTGWMNLSSSRIDGAFAIVDLQAFIVKIRFEEATHLPGKLLQIVPLRVLSSQPIIEVFIIYRYFHKFLS